MRNNLRSLVVVLTLLGPFAAFILAEDHSATNVSNTWARIKDEGKQAFVAGKVKAAFADRKDIPSRYIRIRFDGRVLQLTGFLPNKDAAKAAEELARQVAKPETIQTFWGFDEAIENRESYKTYVGEQTGDMAINAKVLASLNGPDVRPQFKNAEVVHVNVSHGKVTVYIVADAPPDTFDLDPHVKPITGVADFHYRVVKAY